MYKYLKIGLMFFLYLPNSPSLLQLPLCQFENQFFFNFQALNPSVIGKALLKLSKPKLILNL